MGFTYRKYTVNEDFFKTWTPDMAYTLGFIAADGSVQESTKNKGPVLRIASKDKEHLETIRNLLGSTHLIREESNKNGSWSVLAIYSKEIVDDLVSLGIYPNKSLTFRIPNIPDEYMRHFVRGYFDGDGSIYVRTRKDCIIPGLETDIATGSIEFSNELASFLNDKLAGENYRFVQRQNNAGVGVIRGSNQASEALYYYMYGKGGPCLRRKYEKFTDAMIQRNKETA